ncbi:class I SAM-dependent methyltransferase [Flindersiella endophytica]
MPEAQQGHDDAEPNTMSVARVYDYLLGGTNNYAIDRAGAEHIKAVFPELEDWAWCNRGFHQRAARWLATETGIDQFIDIGSGLPTQNNTHEVVQLVTPDSEADGVDLRARVVYVDHDPAVVTQAKRLLGQADKTAFLLGDLRKPDELLNHPELREMIDFDRPVALLCTAVVHFVADEHDPWGLIRRYVSELASGSYLVLSQGTYDKQAPETVERAVGLYQNANEQLHPRSKDDVERFFEGLEMVPPYPGAKPEVCFGGLWGADDPELADDEASRALYGGVGRKP